MLCGFLDCGGIHIGGDLQVTHISNVPYMPCLTVSEYHLANCDNYKAYRDFQDGFKGEKNDRRKIKTYRGSRSKDRGNN